MTVPYSNRVTTCKGGGVFLKLLLRWKGSIYKIVWGDLLIYLVIYYALNLLYTYALDQYGRKHFINIVTYFSKYGSAIPLSFVLGFYVNVVYNRWWSQYSSIPYPDDLAIMVSSGVHGNEDKPKMVRRTIIRYVCLAFTLTLSMISPRVKKRFPTLNHFVIAGLLNREEKQLIQELDRDYPGYSKYWLPCAWAANIATRARSEGMIKDDMALKDIIDLINEFREKCKKLCDYDWICVPLVYTQVVTLAIYLYFLFTIIGSQFIEEQAVGDTFIFRFPLMSLVEFFFYMGWLKVAESLINPFGEDDDDFEVNWMIDRHLQVGYLLVDKIHNEHPKLTKDYHWNQTAPSQLPFTIASQKYMFEHPVESTLDLKVKRCDQDLIYKDEIISGESLLNSRKRSLKKILSRTKSEPQFNLRRVSIKKIDVDEDWDEFNLYEEEQPQNSTDIDTPSVPYPEDFNLLRNERLEKKKEDLLKCLDLLKDDDREKAKKILDEIIK